MSKFDEMLIYLRKRADLTQVELAEKLGVSRSAIGNYEKGIREPDFEMLEKIADFFNVDIDFLLGKSGNEADMYKAYLESNFKEEKEKEILDLATHRIYGSNGARTHVKRLVFKLYRYSWHTSWHA